MPRLGRAARPGLPWSAPWEQAKADRRDGNEAVALALEGFGRPPELSDYGAVSSPSVNQLRERPVRPF